MAVNIRLFHLIVGLGSFCQQTVTWSVS